MLITSITQSSSNN